mgnify:CR=1 FL=1
MNNLLLAVHQAKDFIKEHVYGQNVGLEAITYLKERKEYVVIIGYNTGRDLPIESSEAFSKSCITERAYKKFILSEDMEIISFDDFIRDKSYYWTLAIQAASSN